MSVEERRGLIPNGISEAAQQKEAELNKKFNDRFSIEKKAGKVVVVLKREGDREITPQRFLKLLEGAPVNDQKAQSGAGEDDPTKIHARATDAGATQWSVKHDEEMLVVAKKRLAAAGVDLLAPDTMAA